MNLISKDSEYIANTYSRFPVVLERGKGSIVWDEKGKEYIDLSTGIAVNTFGFCDEDWTKSVCSQLKTLQHTSNLYYSKPCADLAELLCNKTGMKKVFFSNSGAEANECAIKTARKYAAEKHGRDYYNIITLKNSFHGRTVTTLSATGQDVFHHDFLPLTDGFVYASPDSCAEIVHILDSVKCAAVMIELVQGEGGVVPLDKSFVTTLSDILKQRDVLLIADEVQTGNGRTGELYAYMNYGITPDIVTTAKGLGGGLPLGATLFGSKTKDVLTPGSHGSTFGGNPVCCAAALNILNRIDDNLLKEVKEKSDFIISQLSGKEGIVSVTGMGLMLGIETKKNADEILEKCMEEGVLVIKAKNKIRLLPALNIPMNLLEKAVKVIVDAAK